ncbi:MAG: GYF domain-containing protein [Bacteroidota bacterium]
MKENTCPNCHAEKHESTSFCIHCGYKFEEIKPEENGEDSKLTCEIESTEKTSPQISEVTKKYFFHNGQQQLGPFTIEELLTQKLAKDNLVWCEGMENWKPAAEMDELKSLFMVATTPVIKTVSTPPPIVNIKKPAPAEEKKPKKKMLIIILAVVLGSTLLVASGIFVIYKFKKNPDSAITKDSIVQIAPPADSSVKVATENNNIPGKVQNTTLPQNVNKTVAQGNKQQNTTQQQTKQQEAIEQQDKQKEDAQKAKYLKNWRNYVVANVNYNFNNLGGITNAKVTLTNNLPYKVDEVMVWLNYILANGGTWKSEKLTFTNISANSVKTQMAPVSERGTSVKIRLSKVNSNALGLYFAD